MIGISYHLVIHGIVTDICPCGDCLYIGLIVKTVLKGSARGGTGIHQGLGTTCIGQSLCRRRCRQGRGCLGNREGRGVGSRKFVVGIAQGRGRCRITARIGLGTVNSNSTGIRPNKTCRRCRGHMGTAVVCKTHRPPRQSNLFL